jgi:hypothetical protein
MENAMPSLRSVLFLAAVTPFALAACSSTPSTTTTSDYSSVSAKADRAMATSQQALQTAQQAEADAKASDQQSNQAYQRSLTK